jgi:hypothetical protein
VIRYRIRVTGPALEQMDRAFASWREHRDKAPDAFGDDTDEAMRVLRDNPLIGHPVRLRKSVRRIWLERIRFLHLLSSRGRRHRDSRAVPSRGSHPKL